MASRALTAGDGADMGLFLAEEQPPLGYRANGRGLRLVEEEAATVRRILRMRNQAHLSYHEIARRLNEERVPTKRGGRWHAGTARRVVLNPVYRGRTSYAGVDAAGIHTRLN